MRRTQTLAALMVASALALAACGSDSDSDSDSDGGPVTTSDLGIEVAGEMGEKPTLTIPDDDPPGDLQIQVLSEGDGAEVGESDVVVADYLGQTWAPRPPAAETPAPEQGAETPAPEEGGETAPPEDTASPEPTGDPEPYVFDNSYDRGEAAGFSLNAVIPGWKDGLAGQKVGSRVLLSIPPDQGYGAQDGHDLQNDTLVFVVDILDAIDSTASASGEPVADLPDGLPTIETVEGEAPTIDFTGATPPEASDSNLVLTGDGEEVGSNLVVNMVQASYPDGADAISTWDEGQTAIVLAPQQLNGIPGLAEALEGQPVGSRVVSRISAADNVGQDGAEGTPLLFVIDVIGTF